MAGSLGGGWDTVLYCAVLCALCMSQSEGRRAEVEECRRCSVLSVLYSTVQHDTAIRERHIRT